MYLGATGLKLVAVGCGYDGCCVDDTGRRQCGPVNLYGTAYRRSKISGVSSQVSVASVDAPREKQDLQRIMATTSTSAATATEDQMVCQYTSPRGGVQIYVSNQGPNMSTGILSGGDMSTGQAMLTNGGGRDYREFLRHMMCAATLDYIEFLRSRERQRRLRSRCLHRHLLLEMTMRSRTLARRWKTSPGRSGTRDLKPR